MPLYADRPVEDLGDYYVRHVHAMTEEDLHSKSDIAAELAWRDREIDRLKEQNARLRSSVVRFFVHLDHIEEIVRKMKGSDGKAE